MHYPYSFKQISPNMSYRNTNLTSHRINIKNFIPCRYIFNYSKKLPAINYGAINYEQK